MMRLFEEQVARGAPKVRLGELEDAGKILLGRGKIISKNDIAACPGNYPVFSSSASGNGEIGRYGKYMFDDERITWSIDGGGRLFYRPAAKYSVTNVCGWLKVLDGEIDTKYLYFALLDAWSRIDFNYIHKAHPSVIREEYYVFLPPLPVQQAIVVRLEKELSETDRLVANFTRIAERAEEEFKAELEETFLTLMNLTMPLGDVCTIKTGKKDVNQGNPDGQYPFFTCARIPTRADTYSFDCSALLIAGNGDVGFTQKYEGKFEVYQRTYVLYDFKGFLRDYIYYVLQSGFREYAGLNKLGVAMPYIKMGTLTSFAIPYVPIPEQTAIVAKLDAAKARCDKLKAAAEKGLQGAEKLLAAILTEAFEP